MATKRFHNGKWEYRVRRSGVLPRPVYVRFEDEAEGDAYVRRLEALLDRGVVPPEFAAEKPERHARLRPLIIEYRETQPVSVADQGYLKVLLDRLPPKLELREIGFEWASGWVATMKCSGNLSPSTIQHHVGALARCLDWLLPRGLLAVNPLRQLPRGYSRYSVADQRALAARPGGKLKESRARDRRLVADEEQRIRRILDGEKPAGRQRPLELLHRGALKAIFDLALESGMRMSEMYTLNVEQVDFDRRTVFLDRTKNGDKRQVPMTSVAEAVLRGLIGSRRGQVFPWWRGERNPDEMKRCTSLLSRQFGRIFEAAGCGDLNFHDLRHEATSRSYERTTLSDLQIAKITGHKDIHMLSRYANLRGSDLAQRLW